MNLADLDKRIYLEYEVKTSDGMGGETSTWGRLNSCWAAIWPVSAKEIKSDSQIMGVVSHRVRIRYRKGIDNTFRVNFNNRYFNVVSVINPDEDREWLDLMCNEVVG